MSITDKIIIFTGPTISPEEASQILPDANYHLPVKCGDIFRVLRLSPKILVIIDGLFEQTAAVWHKEILFAISRGVHVYGCSSMGALRAAELNEFGMIGSGKIFSYYKNKNRVLNDDEVAITHLMNTKKFNTNIIPLINIHFTLEKAINDKILDKEKAENVLLTIKKIPYFQRSLKIIKKHITDSNLYTFIENNYIDQKKLDAVQLLKFFSGNKSHSNDTELKKFDSTFFIRKLYREIVSSPFEKCYEWLTADEKILCQYQDLDKITHLKILSKAAHNLSDIFSEINVGQDHGKNVDYNDLLKCALSMADKNKLKTICGFYIIYSNLYTDYKKNTSAWSEIKKIIYAISLFLTAIVSYIDKKNIEISPQYQNDFFEKMRRKNSLLKGDDTRAWLTSNEINTERDYQQFILIGSIFHYILVLNNGEFVGINTKMDMKPWLAETLSFCNETHNDAILMLESLLAIN